MRESCFFAPETEIMTETETMPGFSHLDFRISVRPPAMLACTLRTRRAVTLLLALALAGAQADLPRLRATLQPLMDAKAVNWSSAIQVSVLFDNGSSVSLAAGAPPICRWTS